MAPISHCCSAWHLPTQGGEIDLKFVKQLRKAHNNIGNLVSSISKYSQTLELCLVSSLSKFGAQCFSATSSFCQISRTQ